MKPVVLTFIVLFGLICMSCRQQDVRTITVTCPEVVGARAADVVVKALSKTEGVMGDTIKIEDGKVTVTYDSMRTAIKNIEFAIAEAGFTAGEIPADTKARDAFRAAAK